MANWAVWRILALTLAVSCSGCAGALVSTPTSMPPLTERIESVALAPGGGVLADAIGTELFNRGVRVVDTQETTNFLVRAGLDEVEVLQPKSLAILREHGISAVMSMKMVAGYDGKPQSATVRLVSTTSGELVAAANWQNGHGGAAGSPADAMMRKDLVGAAAQIAAALSEQLKRR